ncbi:methyltransferase UbiE [Sorangium cellulosum]|uniref:Methyltransferase UbiE n=1 Tax=Sorangium cellulosum TaxID=56 RepID=A0A2L0EP98_SORCE|nr:class I SAM-dependent methyltransferase [Sorangium cellulosum]AUX41133.1 methyltransferase UbiE [Sorangium cellulosum]
MPTQYDAIAEEYQRAKRLVAFDVFEHTLLGRLGAVDGMSVLDLACGEGFNTRKLKQLGAGRTVGVDISEEMIRLARDQEERRPLGIEYVCSAVEQLGKLGEFDLVTAVFLLNYAESPDALVRMGQVVYENLKPGQRFVTINENCGKWAPHAARYRKYGIDFKVSLPVGDGDPVGLALRIDERSWIDITFRCFCQETYEQALKAAGFRAVTWHGLVVPPEIEARDGKEFWSDMIEDPPVILIECQK